jgi:hypothetical protein
MIKELFIKNADILFISAFFATGQIYYMSIKEWNLQHKTRELEYKKKELEYKKFELETNKTINLHIKK